MSVFSRYRNSINADPITRDFRAYAYGSVAIGIVVVGMMVGLLVKVERKQPPKAEHHGCYMWSDGYVQCIKKFTDRVGP